MNDILSASVQVSNPLLAIAGSDIQAAIDAVPIYGTVIVPPGVYKIESPLKLLKPKSLIGFGRNTRIVNVRGGDAIQIGQQDGTIIRISGITIAGIYFSSVGKTAKVINCQRLSRSKIRDVSVSGGKYGLYFRGAMLNVVDGFMASTPYTNEIMSGIPTGDTAIAMLRSGKEIGSTGGPSCNGNTFLHTLIEGPAYTNGIYIDEGNSEGNSNFYGGCIEGLQGYYMHVRGVNAPMVFDGFHIETAANPKQNAKCEFIGCGLLRVQGFQGAGTDLIFVDCRNVKVEWSKCAGFATSDKTQNMLIEGVQFGNGTVVINGDKIDMNYPSSQVGLPSLSSASPAAGRYEFLSNDISKLQPYKGAKLSTGPGMLGQNALMVTKTNTDYQGAIFVMPKGVLETKKGRDFRISGWVYNPSGSSITAFVGVSIAKGGHGTSWRSFVASPKDWTYFDVQVSVTQKIFDAKYSVDPVFTIVGPSGTSLIFDLLSVKMNV